MSESTREYQVRAVRWEHGWELHIDNDRVTQARTLAEADRVIADYLALDGESDARFTVVPELDERTASEISAVQTQMAQVQQLQAQTTGRYRGLVGTLRHAGMSVSDIARVLKISPGRVSQLTKR